MWRLPIVKTRKIKKIYTFGILARTEKSLLNLRQWFLKTYFLKWHFELFVTENIQRMKVLNGGNYSPKDCFGHKEFQMQILTKCKFLKIEIASSTIVLHIYCTFSCACVQRQSYDCQFCLSCLSFTQSQSSWRQPIAYSCHSSQLGVL